MNKVQLLKHPINYHVAQINFEADTAEELGDWIDQYPNVINLKRPLNGKQNVWKYQNGEEKSDSDGREKGV